MEPDTFRNDIGVDVYWRRRLTALVAVLVMVAIVAWACSAAGGPEGTPEAQAAPASPSPVLSGLPVVTVTPTPSVQPSGRPSVQASSPAPATPAPRPRRPGDPCDPGDLVLSVLGAEEVYGAGSRPRFILTLVNTGKVMCTTDVGPRALEIRITSGPDRVWSSADCLSGETKESRELERGIPYVRQIEWDRRRSGSDCRAERAEARPGTYVAVVRAPRLKSGKVVFHLR
ncbi:hypothetical protein ACFOWE_03275 [Planomonospora corallina]|uniref:DUF4232 domain-containing protein n=1 Tax=Planomonospora corallina TaxID=1806052 RepID=A0ABV8I2A6_9ACTN